VLPLDPNREIDEPSFRVEGLEHSGGIVGLIKRKAVLP
jgi:hypothetical protein